ncbi:hypothetical protein RHMOL_Rhmol01G0066500 [Rhododendron molle]|uniref:Uncharacterized protein n=1 Tax=Rhododendron molle TaxID=49168 RepID=A0ACC0Q069_RHOML|nr:hypothetical protein RHMOL_Rhmol01G0066500 [Rhododendron molle]
MEGMGSGLAYQTYCEYYERGPKGEVDPEAPCFVCWYDNSDSVRKCVGSHGDDIPKIGIHDSCAELPSEMKDHVFHPQHTLTLRTKTSCDSGTTLCDACGRLISWGFYFCCEMCKFYLDPRCATSLRTYSRKGVFDYLGHPHRLVRCWIWPVQGFREPKKKGWWEQTLNADNVSNLRCSGCNKRFKGDVHVCLDCHCLLDRCCADRPSSIEHPFHSQHPLTLCVRRSTSASQYQCDACGSTLDGLVFDCPECKFSLDLYCSFLMPIQSSREGMELQTLPLNHPHPLIICEKLWWHSDDVICHGCKQFCKGSFYVCLHCHCFLDKSCANWAQQIDHPFHPNHPLTLLGKHDHDSSRCNACGKELQGLVFYCSECEFGLDLVCAALMPKQINHLQLGHPHRLTLCEKKENLNFTCYACQLPIKDSFYVCLECHIFLHRSCANLPRNVYRLPHHKHSSPCQHRTLTLLDHLPHNQLVYVPEMHPLHPKYNGDIVRLVVGATPTRKVHDLDDHSKCPECFKLTMGFAYACSECSDYFGISCTLKKSKPHEHPLVYFNIKSNKLKCESCRRSLHTPFFRCEECNFNIHASCVSILPQIVKHRCHRHILSLRYSPVKDFPDEDENAELYCDICEEHRYLLDPTYYCEECHFVSHVHCVIETSEEMHVLVEEWSLPFKLESQKKADNQKGRPALESLASVDEATGVSVEEREAEGSRVAENRLLIIEQDEEIAVQCDKIAVLREEIHCLEKKLSAMDERKEELERRRASNFRLTRTMVMF